MTADSGSCQTPSPSSVMPTAHVCSLLIHLVASQQHHRLSFFPVVLLEAMADLINTPSVMVSAFCMSRPCKYCLQGLQAAAQQSNEAAGGTLTERVTSAAAASAAACLATLHRLEVIPQKG